MRLLKIFAIFVLALIPRLSFATLQVEPYVGYAFGILDTTCITCAPVGGYLMNPSGFTLGSKGVYVMDNRISFGLDLEFTLGGQIQIQSQPIGGSKPSDNFYKIMLNMIGGWQPTEAFKFWGGLILLNNLTDQAGSGNRTFKGDGIRLGGAWILNPNFAINFIYDYQTFKKIDYNGSTYDVTVDYSKFNSSVFQLNCSFPFQF